MRAAQTGDIVDLIRTSRAPGKLKRMVAQGLVHLDSSRLLQSLALLAFDGDPHVRSMAQRTLDAMPESVVVDVCSHPAVPAEVLDRLAHHFSRCEKVLEEILFNPATGRKTVSYVATLPFLGLLEIVGLHFRDLEPYGPILEKLHSRPETTPETIRYWESRREHLLWIRGAGTGRGEGEEEFSSLLTEEVSPQAPACDDSPAGEGADEARGEGISEMIREMTAGKKVALALKGNSQVRRILVNDKNRAVCTKVLENPMITESEVEFYARLTTLSRDVLRLIGTNREWTKKKAIVRALVSNPGTPLGIAIRHLPRLGTKDLRHLAKSRGISQSLRHAAGEAYQRGKETRR